MQVIELMHGCFKYKYHPIINLSLRFPLFLSFFPFFFPRKGKEH